MQTAYEVLSDPQERAWYDTHRDAILRNDDREDAGKRPSNVTTAEDIFGILSRFRGQTDYSDSATGFSGALRDLFHQLAEEEVDAGAAEGLDEIHYPSFGYAKDDHESSVKSFYAHWNGFSTQKQFYWKDVYRYSEAPDRRVRRLMEKENKRIRDEAIREFNDAVRSLVAFVKKRDPRFQPSQQGEKDRQAALKQAANAQAARSRAANVAKESSQEQESVPDWMKTSAADEHEATAADWNSEEDDPREEFECVVCNKTFKSEKQFEAHEKSKKHVKAVQQIKRQMRQENHDLNLDQEVDDAPSSAAPEEGFDAGDGVDDAEKSIHSDGDRDIPETADSTLDAGSVTSPDTFTTSPDRDSKASDIESASTSDEDYASRDKVEQRLFDGQTKTHDDGDVQNIADILADQSLNDETTDEKPKEGKAKEKRAKKAAQKAKASKSASEFRCAACQSSFPSKTQLFIHIKDFGHAQPVAKPSTKGTKGKKK